MPRTSAQVVEALVANAILAVLRLDDARSLVDCAQALAAGGVRTLEVTLTTPGAEAAISALRDASPVEAPWLIGAGSVLDADAAQRAIRAGASFLVSPVSDGAVLAAGAAHGVPVIPGAFSPTECFAAQQRAPLVKLFPAGGLGPTYLRDLLAPMPSLRIVPTGGIAIDDVGAWLGAGAVAVGLGSALVSSALVRDGAWDELTARARRCAAQRDAVVARATHDNAGNREDRA
ncbi:MAG: bifunctional 4-hydroxy-2-oxoglutarate aldolase/2-dehydro-3-deoxy-phosphogluconate aldolase [Gemmatimonadaceae bacterium]|nr:bifunctional 4-hydroxy-2-oxoglutarate aldolase/2-dehydro-3-deoxy-phosphogluconate aldolase [Gemmatimonadaceae bacterium]